MIFLLYSIYIGISEVHGNGNVSAVPRPSQHFILFSFFIVFFSICTDVTVLVFLQRIPIVTF